MSRQFPSNFQHEHTPAAIRKRLLRGPRTSYLRDFVYGAVDGTVTTFAVVSGVKGAELAPSIILILGAANLFADGFSMAASNYLSAKTQNAERALIEEYERKQIELNPAGETEEIRQLFIQKGFQGAALEDAVATITRDKQRWVATMLNEEYGLSHDNFSPIRTALATFAAFVAAGSIPLVPFLIAEESAFTLSIAFTALAFFLIGSLKSLWTIENFWISGLKTLGVGAIAATVAYYVGFILKNLG